MGESVFFFLTNTENFLILSQDPLKIYNFFVKNAYLTPLKKNSSNLHKSQELPEPLSKKLKSVKILYTFTHVIEIKNINEYIDVKNIYEFMVKIVIKSTENIFVILNDVANKLLSHKSEQVTDS